MAEARFSRIEWDATPGLPFTMRDRAFLRSIPDPEADEILAYILGGVTGDPETVEIDRLRDMLEARALALAEERAWQSITLEQRARLIDVAGQRGSRPTEEMARGLIDGQLLVLGGRPSGAHTRFLRLFGFDLPAMAAAGEVLARPGEMVRRFALDNKPKRFGFI